MNFFFFNESQVAIMFRNGWKVNTIDWHTWKKSNLKCKRGGKLHREQNKNLKIQKWKQKTVCNEIQRGLPRKKWNKRRRSNIEKDWRKLSAEELMLLNCGVGEDTCEFLGMQGDPTCQSYRKSVLNIHWKDWCWSWNSNTLATWCEERTHWKKPWCWETLKAGGEGDDRGWDGWMASPTW